MTTIAEDTFDTRPVLRLVPPIPCGHRVGSWICDAAPHPQTQGHYFVSTKAFSCPSETGPGPCKNPTPHAAPRGCVHHSTSGVPDRHDKPGRGDSE